jgi:carboxyl-terminal processing protease
VEITRDVIDIKTDSWELKGNNIAYLNISHFSEDTWSDFKDTARVITRANPNGLILDLRNNPGGYLDTAVNMAGYWIGDKVAVISKDAQGVSKEYQSQGWGELEHIPTIVLVNQGSASASEILAGALQDYGQATILGEKTFGKGSVQELESLSDGSAIKLTVAHWYTPLGRSINENGIEPDIEVELTIEDYEHNRDPQLDRALLILGGEPQLGTVPQNEPHLGTVPQN